MSAAEFAQGHGGAGGAPMGVTLPAGKQSHELTDAEVHDVATQNTAQPRPSSKHPIVANGQLVDPVDYTVLPLDRSHPKWRGITGYDPNYRMKVEDRSSGQSQGAAPAVVQTEGEKGDVRPHPTNGFREVITAHKPDGSAVWTPTVEDNIHPGYVTNMKGFSVPSESLSDEEREQLKQRNRSDDAANKAASLVRTASGARISYEKQEALATAAETSGAKAKGTRVQKPRQPTVGQQAIAEKEAAAPLTRRPWNPGKDGAPSITSVAHEHLAHLESFLSAHGADLDAGSEEAQDHGFKARVHVTIARNALKDALKAKGGGRDQLVDDNGNKLFEADGVTPKLGNNKPQNDILANTHIQTATKAIRAAHQALSEPEVIRATRDVIEPFGGSSSGISPAENSGAAKGLRGYAPDIGKKPKHVRIFGRNFASDDPFIQEGAARVQTGIEMGDPEYTHLAEVYKATFRPGTRRGGEAWTGETSPERAGRGNIRDLGESGQPTGFTDRPVPRNQADIDADRAGAEAPRSARAPKPGKAKATKVKEAAVEGAEVRSQSADIDAADEQAREERRKSSDLFGSDNPTNLPDNPETVTPNLASLSPEAREAKRTRVAAAVAAREAEAAATKKEAKRAKDRARRQAKKESGK